MLQLARFFFTILLLFIPLKGLTQEKNNWRFLTLSEDNQYEIYVDENSIRKADNFILGAFKFYPAKEKREKIREDFLKQAQKFKEVLETEETLPEGWEKLLEALYDEKSHYFTYKVNCEDRKIYVVETKRLGPVSLNFIINVKPNNPSELIYNYLCKFMSNQSP